jgi:hypothetical protein
MIKPKIKTAKHKNGKKSIGLSLGDKGPAPFVGRLTLARYRQKAISTGPTSWFTRLTASKLMLKLLDVTILCQPQLIIKPASFYHIYTSLF